MKTLVGCFVIFYYCLQPAKAQNIYFEKQFDYLNFTENTNNVIPQSDGSYKFLSTGIRFTPEGGTFVRYLHVNGLGDTINTKMLYDSTAGRFLISYTATDKNQYIYQLVTYQNADSGYWKYNLIVFDTEGDVVVDQKFGLDSFNLYACYIMLDTIENAVYLFGQASTTGNGDIYVIKVDTTGFIYWERTYGGANYESPISATRTPDKGFLILGWTRSFGAGQRDFYLVKTDSLGNQEWQKTYGSGANEGGWGITELNEGNYLLTGGRAPSQTQSYGVIKKVSPNGTLIWSKDYVFENNFSNTLYWTKELPDGSLVAVGLTHQSDDAGFFIKTDSDGEVIWQQKYDKGPDVDLFYNVLPTTDGGFLLSGQCHVQGQSQDAWLLKVDSLGCPYPNCTVGIAEEGKLVVFNLWPNPAVNELHIELPGSVSSNFVLRDAIGRSIFQKAFNEKEYTFDLSTIPAGIYTAEIEIGKEKYFKKLIIAKE